MHRNFFGELFECSEWSFNRSEMHFLVRSINRFFEYTSDFNLNLSNLEGIWRGFELVLSERPTVSQTKMDFLEIKPEKAKRIHQKETGHIIWFICVFAGLAWNWIEWPPWGHSENETYLFSSQGQIFGQNELLGLNFDTVHLTTWQV